MAWFQETGSKTRDLLVGFYDLTHYTRFCRAAEDEDVLALMQGYFALTGRILSDSGGVLIKAIGDAGLAAFDAMDTDTGVRSFFRLKETGDQWLAERGCPGKAVIKLHRGPVACGMVGAPGQERFDLYGNTVNTAALLESGGFALSPPVFSALAPETRTLFKKHTNTTSVTYVSMDTTH